jgi:hypothetical protein
MKTFLPTFFFFFGKEQLILLILIFFLFKIDSKLFTTPPNFFSFLLSKCFQFLISKKHFEFLYFSKLKKKKKKKNFKIFSFSIFHLKKKNTFV